MKITLFYSMVCLLTFGFSSQAYAVARTASSEALANTRANARDCRKTTDPNVKYRCEVAAARAAAKAEEAADKKKKEMIATAIAGAGALGAFMNMRKNNEGSAESSGASTTRTSTSNTTGFETTVSTQTTAATAPSATSAPTAAASNSNVTTAPASSPRPSGRTPATDSTDDAESQTVMVSQTTSNSEHQCSNNVTTANISGECKGTSNIMVDVAKNCMCVGEHCFDIQIAGFENSTVNIFGMSELTQGAGGLINFRNPTGGRRIGINQIQQGFDAQRGINIAPAAFPYLNQAIQNSRSNPQLRSLKICSGESAANMAAAQSNATPRLQQASVSTGRTTRSPDTVIVQQQAAPVQSKLTQRVSYAVKVRNQFAPVSDNDSID